MTYGHRRTAGTPGETAYERGYAAGWHGIEGPLGSVEFECGYSHGRHDREHVSPTTTARSLP